MINSALQRDELLVIVGGGPAGLTAAIYACHAGLRPVVIAGEAALPQLVAAGEIRTFPGFPDGVDGADLLTAFRTHAEAAGATLVDRDASGIRAENGRFRVSTNASAHDADAVILATGARPVALGLPAELTFAGRGVSTCATCDGFFFRGKAVVVVGAGDTAVGEALLLTRFATRVTLVVPAPALSAGAVAESELRAHADIEVRLDTEVTDIRGGDRVASVILHDRAGGADTELATQGVFVALGYRSTATLGGDLSKVVAGGATAAGATHGVFVAGDLHDHTYRQVVVAAADGCRAAIDADRWLAETRGQPAGSSTNW